MKTIIHIILSGGFGSRLWPLSRTNFPKPLLPLVDGKSLLELTIDRHRTMIDEQIIVTNEDQFFNLREATQAHQTQETRYIVETCAKNTAPAISLAVNAIQDEDATVLVTPSDHLISPIADYQAHLTQAIELASKQDKIFLFGITPTAPAISFGYIELADAKDGYHDIRSFHEKPDTSTAESYLTKGSFLWNSGIFCFSKRAFIKEMTVHCPTTLQQSVSALSQATPISSDAIKIPTEAMAPMDKVSIDVALIEKTSAIGCLPTNFNWQDLGNFNELKQVFDSQDQNFVQANHAVLSADSTNNVVVARTRPIVLNHVSDLSIIDTEDVLYVSQTGMNNSNSNGFSMVQETLPELQRQLNWEIRPWGRFDVIREEPGFKVKKIQVKPGGCLSLQYHHHRCEHWLVIAGTATIQLNEETLTLHAGESIDIPIKAQHRLQNNGSEPLIIVETQFGDYLGEDDIVRIGDVYDRS